MLTIILSVIYFLTGFIFLALPGTAPSWLFFALKAVMMPLLITLFLINAKRERGNYNLLLLAGLLFSWAGDMLLEIPSDKGNLFVAGLACFLLAQVNYLVLFLATPGKNILTENRKYLLLPLLFYGLILILYLYNGLGAMRIPVIIYAVVILLMLAGAINRFEKVNRSSYLIVLAGAILFVISDSTIAVNKFGHSFTGASEVIMSTYLAAQYLIVTGYLKE